MTKYIYSWNANSEGASLLAREMGIRRIKHERSTFIGGPRHTVINWGSGKLPEEILKSRVLNNIKAVNTVANKLTFFKHVAGKGVSLPDWTTDMKQAIEWTTKGDTVCARQILNGHSAAGLVLMSMDNLQSLRTEAPLYTRYIPKEDEFRVHVVNDNVIDVQRKALRADWGDNFTGKPNYKVRNLDNGFIYVRGDVNPHNSVVNEARAAIRVCGLDFGAVDIIFNRKRQQAYVLEINSAPGITGTTVENYARAFEKI